MYTIYWYYTIDGILYPFSVNTILKFSVEIYHLWLMCLCLLQEPKPAVATVSCCYCGAVSSSLERCETCKRRLAASNTSGDHKPIMLKRKKISKENDSSIAVIFIF